MKPYLALHVIAPLLCFLLGPLDARPSKHFGRCKFHGNANDNMAFCRPSAECKTIGESEASDVKFLEENKCESLIHEDLICCPTEDTFVKVIELVFGTMELPAKKTIELPTPPHCGHMMRDRIYGGQLTGPEEFPWMALIETTKDQNNKNLVCGGVLITDQWVLTAAHCHNGRDGSITGVRLGEWRTDTDVDCVIDRYNIEDCLPKHIDERVDMVKQHPNYTRFSNVNDIALVHLERPVAITAYVKPICLPLEPHFSTGHFENLSAEISGWGRTENNDQTSALKLKATLKIWTRDRCNSSLARMGTTLDDHILCASGGTGVSSCSGDSGGPLMLEQSTFYAIGVISMGVRGCRRNDLPLVFTRVAAYLDWIKETVNSAPEEITIR